jgi:hypothetical protein
LDGEILDLRMFDLDGDGKRVGLNNIGSTLMMTSLIFSNSMKEGFKAKGRCLLKRYIDFFYVMGGRFLWNGITLI